MRPEDGEQFGLASAEESAIRIIDSQKAAKVTVGPADIDSLMSPTRPL